MIRDVLSCKYQVGQAKKAIYFETQTIMDVTPVKTVQKACEYVAKRLASSSENGVFCQEIYDSAKVIDVSLDSDNLVNVSFSVHTSPRLANTVKMVHGGASSTLISSFTVLALAGDPKYWKNLDEPTEEELEVFYKDFGYTRTVNIQIIQAVPLGADVTVKCKVVSNTKSNAYLIGGIHYKGKVLVNGVHDMTKRSLALNSSDARSLRADFQHSRL